MAALPRVLYETLAHPRGTENTFARRMVLASRFRGSSLRLPLSGMVYREIATRTLERGAGIAKFKRSIKVRSKNSFQNVPLRFDDVTGYNNSLLLLPLHSDPKRYVDGLEC